MLAPLEPFRDDVAIYGGPKRDVLAVPAEAVIETLQSTKQNVLVQRFVAESKGRDIRAFVVGDQVVAAMRRVAQGQEFRSNVHRGGRAEAVTLDPVYEETAVRAAQILGLRVAGVDMLEGREGPQVMEVNGMAAAFTGCQQCHGSKVALESVSGDLITRDELQPDADGIRTEIVCAN